MYRNITLYAFAEQFFRIKKLLLKRNIKSFASEPLNMG